MAALLTSHPVTTSDCSFRERKVGWGEKGEKGKEGRRGGRETGRDYTVSPAIKIRQKFQRKGKKGQREEEVASVHIEKCLIYYIWKFHM